MRFRFFLLRFAFFCVFLRLGFFLHSHVNGCRIRRISFSPLPCNMTILFIKNQNNLVYTYFKRRQSKYFLYMKELFINCRFCVVLQCRCALLRLRFLCAFVFFCICFWRFCFYASSFSETDVFVLWNMRLHSLKYASSFFSKNQNDVNLAVASTVVAVAVLN